MLCSDPCRAQELVSKVEGFTVYDATDKYRVVTCTVSKVYDGDNLGCRAKIGRKTQYWNFRLVGIDAPEVRGHQPHYAESREALRQAVLGEEITVELRGYDNVWKRHTVFVSVRGQDVALKQITEGFAWFYPMYARTLTDKQRQAYEDAETNAKSNRIGLWKDEKPINPSDWRKGKR